VQELETGPLHRFQDWPNEQVPCGRPASTPSGMATSCCMCRHERPSDGREDLEVGAGEHAAPARRHEAMLAVA